MQTVVPPQRCTTCMNGGGIECTEPSANEWGWNPTMFWNPPVSKTFWPASCSVVDARGNRTDGRRPQWSRKLEAELHDDEGEQALLCAALAAIACALKLSKVEPGTIVKEQDWPGGCPHRHDGSAVKRCTAGISHSLPARRCRHTDAEFMQPGGDSPIQPCPVVAGGAADG